MSQIKITESSLKSKNIIYIYEMLSQITSQLGCLNNLRGGKNRYELLLDVPSSYRELIANEVEENIADVISVNYKYSFFKKNVNLNGLNDLEQELLLVALISADIEEDRKYIIKKLKEYSEYTLDGIYNFRLKALKEKWYDIVGCVPPSFRSSQLKDFIIYLVRDKARKRVYYDNGNVYDKRYNLLKRRELLAGDSLELPILKEILLSSAGEIELASKLPEDDEKYIKDYYGNHVIFSSAYLKC